MKRILGSKKVLPFGRVQCKNLFLGSVSTMLTITGRNWWRFPTAMLTAEKRRQNEFVSYSNKMINNVLENLFLRYYVTGGGISTVNTKVSE